MIIKSSKIYKYLRDYLVKIRIYREFLHDANRFIKHSNSISYNNNENKLISSIILIYHVIEKGLTMPNMKLGFGQEKILQLINCCNLYIKLYNSKNEQLQHAVSVISEYKTLHSELCYQLPESLSLKIDNFLSLFTEINVIHQDLITQEEVKKNKTTSFIEFAFSRSSLRNYSDRDVPIEEIFKAIEIAQTSPSACNRQPSRVHVFKDTKTINNILNIQNGNRGFGHLTNKILIVTTDLYGYRSPNERYLNWIDGGIYIMNLVYALQYQEIGSCILNWGVDKKRDNQLREICNIPPNETIIAILTCGYFPDNCKIAKSPKKRATDITIVHE